MSKADFKLSNYDYQLPNELIAQEPLGQRDQSRLLVIERKAKQLKERKFCQIGEYFKPGDVLVLNNTKVIKARLLAQRASGAKIEVLLVRANQDGNWQALVNPGRKVKIGQVLYFGKSGVEALVLERLADGSRLLKLNCADLSNFLERYGQVPLPNYIKKTITDAQQYQTVYSKFAGAVAAPTAGFHFTDKLLKSLKQNGVKIVYLTLHCGPATFRPVKAQDIREHLMDYEWVEITKAAAKTINQAKANGKKIIAVGTTAVRSLESAAQSDATVAPFSGLTNLYITPGYKFKIVDCLVTNFHTPCSTNLVLVSVFASPGLIKKAYRYATKEKFRFFSFGDATLIL